VPEGQPAGRVRLTLAETTHRVEVVAGEWCGDRRRLDAGVGNRRAIRVDSAGFRIGRAEIRSARQHGSRAFVSDIEPGGVGRAAVCDDLAGASAHLGRIRRTAGWTFRAHAGARAAPAVRAVLVGGAISRRVTEGRGRTLGRPRRAMPTLAVALGVGGLRRLRVTTLRGVIRIFEAAPRPRVAAPGCTRAASSSAAGIRAARVASAGAGTRGESAAGTATACAAGASASGDADSKRRQEPNRPCARHAHARHEARRMPAYWHTVAHSVLPAVR
jgi:hypothetical protein